MYNNLAQIVTFHSHLEKKRKKKLCNLKTIYHITVCTCCVCNWYCSCHCWVMGARVGDTLQLQLNTHFKYFQFEWITCICKKILIALVQEMHCNFIPSENIDGRTELFHSSCYNPRS